MLKPLGGIPVLRWVVRAAEAAAGIDQTVVATTTEPRDDAIVKYCQAHNVACFRGSEDDVLARFHDAARLYHADVAVRITGDCPFIDPDVIAAVVRLQKQTQCAYASNIEPRTYPDGLDCEAITLAALKVAHREATRPIDRECVTTYIARNRSRFPAATVVNPIPGMHDERWVLDTEQDLSFCHAIEAVWHWYSGAPSQYQILNILDKHPEIRKINANHIMNERYFAALAEEPIVRRSYSSSTLAHNRAVKLTPIGAQTFSKSAIQFPQPSPLFLSHGDGGRCFDIDGNDYVDLVSGLLPNVLGYRDPDVDAAVRAQLCNGVSFSLSTELEAQLAETLVRLIPCAEMVKFAKNGTDVTTAAVRAARAFTKRDRVALTGYHGWADWSLTERKIGIPDAVSSLSYKLPPGDTDALDRYLRAWHNHTACLVIEMENQSPEYLKYAREQCTNHGIVLVFDEILTGFRYHLGGAQSYYGVTPDLACFAKAMANGMPLAALVGRSDIMRKFVPPDNAFVSGTYAGETLSLAAAIATIAKLERNDVVGMLWQIGTVLRNEAQTRIDAAGLGKHVHLRGEPIRTLLDFSGPEIQKTFIREMVASGTLIIVSHNVCYAHTGGDIRRVLKSYDHTLETIKRELT
jgi:glutamate-1-semialdehyde aminotransferase/spore coat polysaccharide biosynthesis protein SpsF (cytidylyltransferase family)